MAKRGNGEGSIIYHKKLNRWMGQFTAGYKADGSINRKTVYGKTRKEVSEKITAKQNEVNTKTFIDKSSVTFGELAKEYIEQKHKSNITKDTSYVRNLNELRLLSKTELFNMPVQKIKIRDINKTLAEYTEYSNSSIDKINTLIRATLDTAVLNKIIASNPYNIKGAIIKPKSTKLDKKIEALTIDEQKQFLAYMSQLNGTYKDILLIALYSGMRIGEILALSGEDINIKNKTIHIKRTLTRTLNDQVAIGDTTKTYAGARDVPILPQIMPILRQKNKGLLFTHENGKLIIPVNVNTYFKKVCKEANINISVNTHMLRHTFATRCIESGMSAVVLSKILGHKKIDVTLNTYTSVFNKFKEDEIVKVTEYFTQLL